VVRASLLTLCLAAPALAADLTRGPVLQLAGPTDLTITFHTSSPAIGEVRFGELHHPLARRETELTPGLTHVIHLTGLTPSTRYLYEVWIDGEVRAAGPTFTFRTSPPVGVAQPFRLFAWGDSGTANVNQLAVAQRLSSLADEATLSLILGDIIYDVGAPELYDARFFEPYAALTRRMVVWPTIGNHDVALDPTGQPYLDAFTLPTNNPAGSELYYSFDYGDAHFVCLDTHVSGHGPGAAQLLWAADDLAASNAKWKFVFFHVPPYSGGNHADDPSIIANILPVLEAAGVDVVFCGHSHTYERTFLLSNSTIVQPDRADYLKAQPDAGTLYLVSGSGGQTGPLSNPNHPLMAFQAGSVLGALLVDVEGDQLRGTYLLSDGSTIDGFRLQKGPDTAPPRILTVRESSLGELDVVFDEPVQGGAERGGVERASAWSVRFGGPVTSARLQSDARTVRLRMGERPIGPNVVSLARVVDRDGNAAPASAAFESHQRIELTRSAAWVLADAEPANGWQLPGADETGWREDVLPVGFGVATAKELVPATTFYVRQPFTVPVSPEALAQLELELDFDDGFVATLNGVEVARQNVAWNQGSQTPASGRRARGLLQHLVLPVPPSVLRSGENVLAVEVHNADGAFGSGFWWGRLLGVLQLEVDGGTPVVPPYDAGLPDAMVPGGPYDPPRPDPDHGATSTLGGTGCGCSSAADLAILALLPLLLRRRGLG